MRDYWLPGAHGQKLVYSGNGAAIKKGAHKSALSDDAVAYAWKEAQQKVAGGFATIVKWDDIKNDPPKNLKISPIAMIPHKSRDFRAILDLSYKLMMAKSALTSVNDASEDTSPPGALANLGSALPRLISAVAVEWESKEPLLFSKLDIKDGFWRLTCGEGAEYNFAYVLPASATDPPMLIIPTALQMGWVHSPAFFCAASETARDLAAEYMTTPVGSLPAHPLENKTMPTDNLGLPDTTTWSSQEARTILNVWKFSSMTS